MSADDELRLLEPVTGAGRDDTGQRKAIRTATSAAVPLAIAQPIEERVRLPVNVGTFVILPVNQDQCPEL
jgi:hypothetical protein